MTRREIREHLFVILFRVDFHNQQELEEQVLVYLEEMEKASKKVKAEIHDKFYAVIDHIQEIDARIEAKSQGWEIERMAKADVTILRLAVYELLFDEKVPTGVAINEAVELAKQYGTDKSTVFINGVLASIAKQNESEPERPEENQ